MFYKFFMLKLIFYYSSLGINFPKLLKFRILMHVQRFNVFFSKIGFISFFLVRKLIFSPLFVIKSLLKFFTFFYATVCSWTIKENFYMFLIDISFEFIVLIFLITPFYHDLELVLFFCATGSRWSVINFIFVLIEGISINYLLKKVFFLSFTSNTVVLQLIRY